ncbi:glycosyltransferase family 4 protein [Salinimicrobium sp. GXAS 041]|uniref:glycosyltransferase family 4 protein n=1 Tax=Salinimicrobium sp. GXAS 041 TaxID=3400806 RepID=UPI003C77BC25
MKIILFNHPFFSESMSITKYTHMIMRGMQEKGHEVQIWTAPPVLTRLNWSGLLKKYIGYIDQYLIFPILAKFKIRGLDKDTLFVLSDQALGPWVPLVSDRPHVIHCHDFMAQKSVGGGFEENRLKWSGKIYQWFIRRGFNRGNNFICISENTRQDLMSFLSTPPNMCDVIYNGLNQDFKFADPEEARLEVSAELKLPLQNGFILHVGGNHFYKNRKGILKIYDCWRGEAKNIFPLLFVGAGPDEEMKILLKQYEFSDDVFFATKVGDELLKTCYQAASVLLFPSIEEGFGWPIAEAMASGCPVITTQKAPMTEVGGNAATYIPPYNKVDENGWLNECAHILEQVLCLSTEERDSMVVKGLNNARRFNSEAALEAIANSYEKVLHQWSFAVSPHEKELFTAK